jgi:hypothetical protein
MSRIATSHPAGTASPGRSGFAARKLSIFVLAAVVVLLGGAFVLGGTEALAGAAVGLALVAVFLASGRLPFLIDTQLAPGVAYLVLGINYLFRVVLLLVALIALKDQPWLDARALGVVVIAGALVWNAMALRRHLDAARNTTSEVIDAELSNVNSEETKTDSDESIPSTTRTVGGGR